MVFQDCGFNARDLSLFVDLDFGDKVTPVDVQDGMETTLMEALVESDVAAVAHPHLRAVGKCGENYGLVDMDLFFKFVFHTLLYSLPKALFALAGLLSTSLSILASEKMI